MGSFLTGGVADMGSIIGAGLGFMGQRQANEQSTEQSNANRVFNAQQAQLNRNFQAQQQTSAENWMTQMSDTSMQRRVADLKASGLNPMLAIGQGGASTPGISAPSGATAQSSSMPQIGNVGAAALQGAATASQINLQQAQANQANQQARKTGYEGDILQVDTTPDMLMLHVQQLQAQYSVTSEEASRINATKQLILSQTTGQDLANTWQQIQNSISRMNERELSATITEMINMTNAVNAQQTQEAKNITSAQSGLLGKTLAYAQATAQTLNAGASSAAAVHGALYHAGQTVGKFLP